jgi:hypothetical protein
MGAARLWVWVLCHSGMENLFQNISKRDGCCMAVGMGAVGIVFCRVRGQGISDFRRMFLAQKSNKLSGIRFGIPFMEGNTTNTKEDRQPLQNQNTTPESCADNCQHVHTFGAIASRN